MKKRAIIGGVALLLVVIAIGVRHLRPAGGAPLSSHLVVTFLAFTNTAGGGQQALFYFTNPTPRLLHFEVKLLEYKTDSRW